MSAAQFEILRPFITDRIQTLLYGRLFGGMRLYDADNHRLEDGISEADAKLVILLVQIANPMETLNAGEKKLLTKRQQVRISSAEGDV